MIQFWVVPATEMLKKHHSTRPKGLQKYLVLFTKVTMGKL